MSTSSVFSAHVNVEAHPSSVPAVRRDVADIVIVGAQPALFRTVARAFRAAQWTIIHARSLDQAMEYLGSNIAAVVITEIGTAGDCWRESLSQLKALAAAPEVIVVANDKSLYGEVVKLGGYDILERPMERADLLWTVATAWHEWMKRREHIRFGGGLCSDA